MDNEAFKAIENAMILTHNNALNLALALVGPISITEPASDYEKQAYDIRVLVCEQIRSLKR